MGRTLSKRLQKRWSIIPIKFRFVPLEGEQVTVLELRVHPEDLGKWVIGRQGRTRRKSMRTILGAAGMKIRKRLTLEILE